jgi:hypothetical protein
VTDISALKACTLPTVERPLRLAEFDNLFSAGLMAQQWLAPNVLRWLLDPAVESVARDLTAHETECCSFFEFRFGVSGDRLEVEVEVPPKRKEILDALAQRAAAAMGTK